MNGAPNPERAVVSVMARSRAAWWPLGAIKRAAQLGAGLSAAEVEGALGLLVEKRRVETDEVDVGSGTVTQYRLVRR